MEPDGGRGRPARRRRLRRGAVSGAGGHGDGPGRCREEPDRRLWPPAHCEWLRARLAAHALAGAAPALLARGALRLSTRYDATDRLPGDPVPGDPDAEVRWHRLCAAGVGVGGGACSCFWPATGWLLRAASARLCLQLAWMWVAGACSCSWPATGWLLRAASARLCLRLALVWVAGLAAASGQPLDGCCARVVRGSVCGWRGCGWQELTGYCVLFY